jgi:Sap, sulfolipid-1-addressing protein
VPGFTLLLQVIPFAVGAAISPAVLTVQILVLSGGKGSLARGWALALGRMAALLAVSVWGVALLTQLPDFGTGEPSQAESVILAIAGGVLLVLAVVESRRPPRAPSAPSFSGRLVDANVVVQFLFGAVWMVVNASTLALYIPGLHVITSSSAAFPMQVTAFVVLFVAASAAALLPTLAVTLYGDRAQPVLADIHAWVEHRAHTITIVVCAVFGLALLGYGLVVLFSL